MGVIDEYDPRKAKRFQILDHTGKVVNKKHEPRLTRSHLTALYDYMLLTRTADEKAFKLQRSGRMGTFATVTGQEAQVGVALAMKPQDWLFPSFRETACLLLRGMPLHHFFLTFMGNEEGNRMPKDTNNFPISVPVGTQTLHAAGAAWAAKIKKDKIVTIGFLGDGGTSEGDFHEALNFMGVFKLPCVLVCQNNQYAISVPRSQQTASATIAEKAFAYGFNGIQVDGNDPLALYVAALEAIEKARKGKGPTLIESYTYRLGPHTTSDDPTLYRSAQEEERMKQHDPLIRFRAYLKKKGIWTPAYDQRLLTKITTLIDNAIRKAESTKLTPDDIFTYLYASIPKELEEQLAHLKDVMKA